VGSSTPHNAVGCLGCRAHHTRSYTAKKKKKKKEEEEEEEEEEENEHLVRDKSGMYIFRIPTCHGYMKTTAMSCDLPAWISDKSDKYCVQVPASGAQWISRNKPCRMLKGFQLFGKNCRCNIQG
jgi:hypothetical protein